MDKTRGVLVSTAQYVYDLWRYIALSANNLISKAELFTWFPIDVRLTDLRYLEVVDLELGRSVPLLQL